MISIFFEAYPEEIAYSWFARYNELDGHITNMSTSKDLFGKERVTQNVLYPINLHYFIKQLPFSWNITIDEIINKNTILPLYLPFMDDERANRLVNGIIEGNSQNVKGEIGVNTGNIFKEEPNIKICYQCYKADIEKYNEAYIHRSHQVPGNYICSQHGDKLLKYTIPYDISSGSYINISNLSLEKLKNISFCEQYKNYYIKLAKNIDCVLSGVLKDYNINLIKEKYRSKLEADGYAIFDGNINMSILVEKFNTFYPKGYLEEMESFIDIGKRKSWISLMITKSNSHINPIRHLLFIIFLFGGVEEFIKYNKVYKPFGNGPWVCLNSICENYQRPVINEIQYRTFRKKPVGIFKCPFCGFAYSRVGPDMSDDDKDRLGKIEDYGELWYSKLYEMIVIKRYSIRRIARELKCSHITIVKQAKKIGVDGELNTKLNGESKTVKKKLSDKELTEYKQKVLNYIKENPTALRQNVKEALAKECGLLYIRDRKWLDKNLPKPRKKSTFSIDYKDISWEDKERELIPIVISAIEELKNEEILKRITKTLISKKTRNVMLANKNYLKKMPEVEKIIYNSCETVEQFKQGEKKNYANNLKDT